MAMLHRQLGASGLTVSALSLGSWRTYERIPREQGVAVLNAARAAGIDFLEIARYNDETGQAPIPTGYSEVVFGELFPRADYARDEVLIATKLWWEFWPEQNAAQELDGALERTGLDHFDLLYSDPPPASLSLDEVVSQVGALLAAGRARAWGVVNWPAERIAEAGRIALQQGVAPPCMAQLPYSLVRRDWVESPEMADALELCGASLIPSFTLAGGLLTGKYAGGLREGRMAAELDEERWEPAGRAVDQLLDLAAEIHTTPAALAIAFALDHPRTASVLVGATRPEQIEQNAAAAELHERLSQDVLERLRVIGL
jgi:aryl-alcohol dehydrogenase-like predicted oxidoreductase